MVEGVCLQSGGLVSARLSPASHPTGIRFTTPSTRSRGIAARVERLEHRPRTTQLGDGFARAAGVEHLLAACHGLGVCCLAIALDADEVPGLDGSARDWVAALDRAGLVPCGGRQAPLRARPLAVGDGPRIEYQPIGDDALEIVYRVDFRASGGAREEIRIRLDERSFRRELAGARSFAVRGVDAAPLAGVAAPCLWSDTARAERRCADELVRHKVLDLLGDLALVGRPLAGRVVADRAGHRLHHELAVALAGCC